MNYPIGYIGRNGVMNIICPKNPITGAVPVKKYLLQNYGLKSSDNESKKQKKIKILARFNEGFKDIINNNGRPCAPLSEPVRNYGFIKVPVVDTTVNKCNVRIFCVAYNGKHLILLHAYDKPYRGYKPNKYKEFLKNQYKIADEKHKEFIKNPGSYEEYNNEEFL